MRFAADQNIKQGSGTCNSDRYQVDIKDKESRPALREQVNAIAVFQLKRLLKQPHHLDHPISLLSFRPTRRLCCLLIFMRVLLDPKYVEA